MRDTIRHLGALTTILVAGMVLPCAIAAQGTGVQSAPPRSAAEALEAWAGQSKAQASDWSAAAEALVQAAKLRTAADPRALNDLFTAAGAYEIAGQLDVSRSTTVEGAKRALRMGAVNTAAHAYLAAARLSIRMKDTQAAGRYLEHAGRLAASPKLTPEQQRIIVAQLELPGRPAVRQ